MADESQQDPRATRRGVLLGVGLLGVGGVLAGCSTAPVPYDASEAGVAPGEVAPLPSASAAIAGEANGAGAGNGNGNGAAETGILLGLVSEIPVGGGTVFRSQQVVVTQPASGVFKAFTAVCTHLGCICNKVANGTIDCPCHGSEFNISDGAVVAGPAPAPLAARTIAIADGNILLQ